MAEANNLSSLCGSSTSSELPQLTAVLEMNGGVKEDENNFDVPRSPLSGNCLLSGVSHSCSTTPVSSSGTILNSPDSRCLPIEKFILSKTRNLSIPRISPINLNDRALAITSMSNDASNTTVSVNSKKVANASNFFVEKNESRMSSKFTVAGVLRNAMPDHQGSASSMLNVQNDGLCSHQYMDMTSQCSQRVQCDECNALYSNDVHFSGESSKHYSHALGTEDRVFQNLFHNVCVPSTSGVKVGTTSMLNSDCSILCNTKLIAPCESSRFSNNSLDQTHVPGFSLDSSHDESVPSVHVSPDCSKCVSNHNKRVQFMSKNFATARESIPEMCKCYNSKFDSSLPLCKQMHHNRNACKHCHCDDLCSASVQLINNSSGSEGLDVHHANTERFSSHTVGSLRDAHNLHICMGIKASISDKEIPSVSSNSPKSFLPSEQNFKSASAYSVSESNGFCNRNLNCQRLFSERSISATASPTILHHLQPPVPQLDDLFHQKTGHCVGPDISHEMHDTNACEHVSASLTDCSSLGESSEIQCGHHHEHLSEASKSVLCEGSETFAQFGGPTKVSQSHSDTYNDDWQSTRCTACLNCKLKRRELCCRSGNHSYDGDKCRDFCSPCHVTFSSTKNKLSDASTQIAFSKPMCNKFSSHTSAMEPVRETFRSTPALANLPSNHSLKKKVIQKLNRHKFRSPFKESATSTYQRKTRSASFWMTCVSLANKAGIPRPVLSSSRSSWEGNSLSSPRPISSVPRPDILIQGRDQRNLMPSKDSSSKVDECLLKKDAVSTLPEHFPVSELQRKLLNCDVSNINDSSNLTDFKVHSCSGNESSCSSNKFSDNLQLTRECSSMLELKMLLEKSLQLGSTCPTLHPQKSLPEHGINKNLNDESNVPVQAVHTQVDYIHCLVPDLLAITGCSFYWGKMDRYEAENLLNNRPEGTFLLRDSAQTDYLFSVSFRRYGKSLHARVEQGNHKFSFDSHDPDVFASDTVSGLIQHYKDPSCCMFFEPMLTIPLCRSFPFPLQHLCRAAICSSTTYDGINKLKLPKVLRNYLKEYHYKQLVRIRRFDQ